MFESLASTENLERIKSSLFSPAFVFYPRKPIKTYVIIKHDNAAVFESGIQMKILLNHEKNERALSHVEFQIKFC